MKKYSVNDLKLVALDPIKFSDRDVFLLFLDVEMKNKEEIIEALQILKKYRPKLLKEFEKVMRSKMMKKKRQRCKNCKCKDNKNCDCRKNKPAE
jgi:hypothetical protein